LLCASFRGLDHLNQNRFSFRTYLLSFSRSANQEISSFAIAPMRAMIVTSTRFIGRIIQHIGVCISGTGHIAHMTYD
jgi:hypothetical protein